MKLTLDTNCLINHFDAQTETATSREEIGQLIRYATSGRCDVAITTRAVSDLNQDKDEGRRAWLLRQLEVFEVVASVLRWGESMWGGGDQWPDRKVRVLANEIQSVLFPGLTQDDKRFGNKICDVDHIVGHLMAGRDIFVTDDNHLNRRASELQKLGAVVMRPIQCVNYIENIDRRRDVNTLVTTSSVEYQNQHLSGRVTFDYSNNNGRFAIGEGHFLFETIWSKASDRQIYAYKDAPSIESIALVKVPDRIELIVDATKYDYSSRCRAPKIGEVVLWRSVNGLYAATQILAIADDSRGAMHDELSFEFRILTEGVNFAV